MPLESWGPFRKMKNTILFLTTLQKKVPKNEKKIDNFDLTFETHFSQFQWIFMNFIFLVVRQNYNTSIVPVRYKKQHEDWLWHFICCPARLTLAMCPFDALEDSKKCHNQCRFCCPIYWTDTMLTSDTWHKEMSKFVLCYSVHRTG